MKTITFLDNNVSGHWFIYGRTNKNTDRTDLRLNITAVPLTFTVAPTARNVPSDQLVGPLVTGPSDPVFQTS